MANLHNNSSPPASPRRGRPAAQQRVILDDLRRQIASGVLAPGDRLPSHSALIERYNVSLVTVQRAMKVLDAEGCIRSVPKKGRFVAEAPPARCRFALVFPGHPEPTSSSRWRRLFAAQLAAADQLNVRTSYQWESWFDVNRTEGGDYSLEHERLCQAVREHRVAGLFFATAPHYLGDSPLLRQSSVPMMAMTTSPGAGHTVPCASYDVQSFVSLAVAHLRQRRRRRVAWLTPPQFSVEQMRREVQRVRHGSDVTIRPEWALSADPYHPDWLEHALAILMNGPTRRRPNAIIVRDDHLLAPTLRGLRALEIDVPRDLAVVGHWNFPLADESDVPVQLIGFDAVEQLADVSEALATGATALIETAACTAEAFHSRRGRSVALSELSDPRFSAGGKQANERLQEQTRG